MDGGQKRGKKEEGGRGRREQEQVPDEEDEDEEDERKERGRGLLPRMIGGAEMAPRPSEDNILLQGMGFLMMKNPNILGVWVFGFLM